MERAADRARPGMRNGAADGRQPFARRRAQVRHRAQQRAGIGMARCCEQLRNGCEFDDAAEIHHRDIVGHLRDHAHVMGDQHQRHTLGALQAAQ